MAIAECPKDAAQRACHLRDVLRLGPNPVRRKADLLVALAELTETDRARFGDDGRTIQINPALLRD